MVQTNNSDLHHLHLAEYRHYLYAILIFATEIEFKFLLDLYFLLRLNSCAQMLDNIINRCFYQIIGNHEKGNITLK